MHRYKEHTVMRYISNDTEIIEPSEQDKTQEQQETTATRIREYEFNLQFITATQTEHVTDKISGWIEAVILDCSKPCNILIYIDGMPETILLNEVSLVGKRYIMPRKQPTTTRSNEAFEIGHDKWCISDKLRIFIVGTKEAVVKGRIIYSI